MKNAAMATRTVTMPYTCLALEKDVIVKSVTSNMKIQRQAFKPPTPLMKEIPYARRPLKAPAMPTAEKNRAIRHWYSYRVYHMVR